MNNKNPKNDINFLMVYGIPQNSGHFFDLPFRFKMNDFSPDIAFTGL